MVNRFCVSYGDTTKVFLSRIRAEKYWHCVKHDNYTLFGGTVGMSYEVVQITRVGPKVTKKG